VSDRQEIVRRVCLSTGLDEKAAEHLVQEVLYFYRETLVEYVRRAHRELSRQGVRNEEAYRRICSEVNQRVFRVDTVTERQVRRMIYG
jgi:hypothetical protein